MTGMPDALSGRSITKVEYFVREPRPRCRQPLARLRYIVRGPRTLTYDVTKFYRKVDDDDSE